MEYGRVLKRAWEITWRWKVLWIFGFLVSLGNGGGGGGGGGGSSSYSGNGIQIDRWGGDWPELWAAISGLVVGLLCLVFIIAIALWVVSTIARGGLIAGVHQVEDEGSTGFGQAWRVGASRFWTLFGISVLTGIPILITVLVTLAVLGGGVAASVGMFEVSEAAGGITVAGVVLFAAALCCVMIPLSVVLGQIRIYAERAAVLEGLGWIDAFKRGWQVLKDNLGPTIVLWLIFLLIGIVLGAVLIGGIVGLIAPFGIFAANTHAHPGPWILAPLCFGGLIAVILFSLIGSIVETFSSATWTLAYRELTGWRDAQAEVAEETPEELVVED